MNKFDKPLNEWTEEEIEIPTVEPETNKYGKVIGTKQGTRKTTQKVYYSQASEPYQMSCSELGHQWYIKDPHIHQTHCKNCKKVRFITAIFEKVENGKILHRDTGQQVA